MENNRKRHPMLTSTSPHTHTQWEEKLGQGSEDGGRERILYSVDWKNEKAK